MKYEDIINENETQLTSTLCEPAIQLEASVEEKIAYLKENLHPSTVSYLEPLDFMLNQPFPYDEYDAHWFNEADGHNPVVSDEIIKHDREVWLNAV